MSWGLTVPDVFLQGIHKDKIDSELESVESTLSYIKESLIALGVSSPFETETSWPEHVVFTVRDLWEDMEDLFARKRLLNIAKSQLDKCIQS